MGSGGFRRNPRELRISDSELEPPFRGLPRLALLCRARRGIKIEDFDTEDYGVIRGFFIIETL